jgi:hypothetical protein
MEYIKGFCIILVLLFSCTEELPAPGQIKFMPCTGNYILGLDSSYVIINRENGQVISTIKRSGQ